MPHYTCLTHAVKSIRASSIPTSTNFRNNSINGLSLIKSASRWSPAIQERRAGAAFFFQPLAPSPPRRTSLPQRENGVRGQLPVEERPALDPWRDRRKYVRLDQSNQFLRQLGRLGVLSSQPWRALTCNGHNQRSHSRAPESCFLVRQCLVGALCHQDRRETKTCLDRKASRSDKVAPASATFFCPA